MVAARAQMIEKLFLRLEMPWSLRSLLDGIMTPGLIASPPDHACVCYSEQGSAKIPHIIDLLL